MSGQHLAAMLPSVNAPFEVTYRPTPTPGPHEVLIEVKSIALNPLDWVQQAMGVNVDKFPTVLGSDVAGTVISVGSSVSSDAPQPGSRVAAFTPIFLARGTPDYGAFQKHVLAPAPPAVPLPEGMSFNEAGILPMAVRTAWAGWYTIDVPFDTKYTPENKKGMLVWGGASSVGSAAVCFDYKAENAEDTIVRAAKEDGLTFQVGFDAVGGLKLSVDILIELKGEQTAKLVSAPLVPNDAPGAEGVEVKFMMASDGEKRIEFSHFVFRTWLKEKLADGEFVPSPKVHLLRGGLNGIQNGIILLKKGVSGVKLVLEV